MLAIDFLIASLVASNFLFPDVPIVSKTLKILVPFYSSFLSMPVVVITRFVLESVAKIHSK